MSYEPYDPFDYNPNGEVDPTEDPTWGTVEESPPCENFSPESRYEAAKSKLMRDALRAEELYGVDECERWTEERKQKAIQQTKALGPSVHAWVATTLANDEASTDDELLEHFQKEGPMSEAEARFYVAQRNAALRSPLEFRLQSYQ